MRRRTIAFAALVPLVALGALGVVVGLDAFGSSDTAPVTVTIRRGSNFPEAAESLSAHGIISRSRLFGFYASAAKRDRTIRYGTYLLERGATWNEVLTALELGRGIVRRVRVTEGWALWDIVPAIAAGLTLPEEEVLAAMRDTVFLRRAGVPRGQS